MLSILTILAICLFTNAQEKPLCIYEGCSFEPGQIVYLFGDQVQLREAPTIESKVLKTLPIGMHLVVQEMNDQQMNLSLDEARRVNALLVKEYLDERTSA